MVFPYVDFINSISLFSNFLLSYNRIIYYQECQVVLHILAIQLVSIEIQPIYRFCCVDNHIWGTVACSRAASTLSLSLTCDSVQLSLVTAVCEYY